MNRDKYLTYSELKDDYHACDEALDTFARDLGRDGCLSLGQSGLIGLLVHPEGRQHISWLLGNTPANWDFDMLDLSGTNLARLCVANQHVTACEFIGAELYRATFRRAYIDGCNFSGANLYNGNFYDSYISGTSFASANLQSSYFAYTELNCCHFYKADLRDANFHDTSLMGSCFGEAKLVGADFRGATGLHPHQRKLLKRSGAIV